MDGLSEVGDEPNIGELEASSGAREHSAERSSRIFVVPLATNPTFLAII